MSQTRGSVFLNFVSTIPDGYRVDVNSIPSSLLIFKYVNFLKNRLIFLYNFFNFVDSTKICDDCKEIIVKDHKIWFNSTTYRISGIFVHFCSTHCLHLLCTWWIFLKFGLLKINLSPRPIPITHIHWSSQCRNYPMRRSVSAFGFQQVYFDSFSL